MCEIQSKYVDMVIPNERNGAKMSFFIKSSLWKIFIILVCVTSQLAFGSQTNTIGVNNFIVSDEQINYGSDYDLACKNLYGAAWRIAEWQDLVNYHSSGGSLSNLVSHTSLDTKISAWVTRDGSSNYSSSRDYFVSYHNRSKPSHYLAHDEIDQNFLSLGSWYSSQYVLCFTSQASAPDPSKLGAVVSIVSDFLLDDPYVSDQSNLLLNPGYEDGLNNWITDNAITWQSDPLPHNGAAYLMGAMNGNSTSYTYQDINIGGGVPPLNLIDSGAFSVVFGGWQSGWNSQRDSGKIKLTQYDNSGAILGDDETEWFYSNHTWLNREKEVNLMPGARLLKFAFYGMRKDGSDLDAYLDDSYVYIKNK